MTRTSDDVVMITVGDVDTVGPARGLAGATPIWGIIFQLNRGDGIGTAIGITVRCEDREDAQRQAVAQLQSFLSDALSAATKFEIV